MMDTSNQSGFIALISVIIISALLLTIVVALNLTGFLGRYNILDSEFKAVSNSLAESCIEVAMLDIAKGAIPATNTSIDIDANHCTIVSVTGTGTLTINTQAIYNGAYTNLTASFIPATNTINSWQEVSHF